jgi:hypothetical protein
VHHCFCIPTSHFIWRYIFSELNETISDFSFVMPILLLDENSTNGNLFSEHQRFMSARLHAISFERIRGPMRSIFEITHMKRKDWFGDMSVPVLPAEAQYRITSTMRL